MVPGSGSATGPEFKLKHSTEFLALLAQLVAYRCTTAQGMYKYRRGFLKIVKETSFLSLAKARLWEIRPNK